MVAMVIYHSHPTPHDSALLTSSSNSELYLRVSEIRVAALCLIARWVNKQKAQSRILACPLWILYRPSRAVRRELSGTEAHANDYFRLLRLLAERDVVKKPLWGRHPGKGPGSLSQGLALRCRVPELPGL